MHAPHPGPIRIAGAGPAGLAAAITLARAGRRVEVYEARETVGGRFIGDFQVLENHSHDTDVLEDLDRMGIQPPGFFRPATEAVFYNHRLHPYPVRSHRPYGYFLTRGGKQDTLDSGLLAQARALGVTVHFGIRMPLHQAHIVATGPATPDGLARQMTFATDLPDTVWVLLDMEVAPGGYAYLFVWDHQATLGTAITRDFPRINVYFQRALDRLQAIHPFAISGERTGYSFMNFTLNTSAVLEGRLHAGEAGGFQDYLFGLGLRYALTTGTLAARSLLENTDYDQAWKSVLGSRQAVGVANRFLYERLGNPGLSLFARFAARHPDFQEYLLGWYRDSGWKRVLRRVLLPAWRNPGSCNHRLPAHWCRRTEHLKGAPKLGPVRFESETVGRQRAGVGRE